MSSRIFELGVVHNVVCRFRDFLHFSSLEQTKSIYPTVSAPIVNAVVSIWIRFLSTCGKTFTSFTGECPGAWGRIKGTKGTTVSHNLLVYFIFGSWASNESLLQSAVRLLDDLPRGAYAGIAISLLQRASWPGMATYG